MQKEYQTKLLRFQEHLKNSESVFHLLYPARIHTSVLYRYIQILYTYTHIVKQQKFRFKKADICNKKGPQTAMQHLDQKLGIALSTPYSRSLTNMTFTDGWEEKKKTHVRRCME